MRLLVAAWNVYNLLPVGADPSRGPQSPHELAAKLARTAEVISSLFGGRGPDLLGLAEIGNKGLLRALLAQLPSEYVHCWCERGSRSDSTGLAIIGRTDSVAQVEFVDEYRQGSYSRPWLVVARCYLKAHTEPIVIAMNHWKSDRPNGPVEPTALRADAGNYLGRALRGLIDVRCAIVMGDFNDEPFAPSLCDTELSGQRYFNRNLFRQATIQCLYNPMWRFLCEADFWNARPPACYEEPRPKTSWCGHPTRVWDQLLVSGRALHGGPLQLDERSVGYYWDDTNSERNADGHIRPQTWAWKSGDWVGASDHFPVVAEFEIVEG